MFALLENLEELTFGSVKLETVSILTKLHINKDK